MGVLLRSGKLFREGGGWPDVADGDCLIEDGRIAALGPEVPTKDHRVVDCQGKWICPGFVDLSAQLGEPGFEHRETIASGGAAAAHGGFVTICAAPETAPINDTRAVTELIIRLARDTVPVRVWPLAALTTQLAGERLAELGELAEAGAVAAATGSRWVTSSAVMRRAVEYAATFGLPVIVRPLDGGLAESGVMSEGAVASSLGLAGIPSQAETNAVARDLEVAELTGARLVLTHLSTAGSVDLVARAKARGVGVTAALTAAHMVLTEAECLDFDPRSKLMPPLRTEADRQALVAGVETGVIDCILSGHDPMAEVDKEHEFSVAAPGGSMLETVVPAVLELITRGELSASRAIDALAMAPMRALGLQPPAFAVGGPADLCVIDPAATWRAVGGSLASKASATPFRSRELVGRVDLTAIDGVIAFERGRESL